MSRNVIFGPVAWTDKSMDIGLVPNITATVLALQIDSDEFVLRLMHDQNVALQILYFEMVCPADSLQLRRVGKIDRYLANIVRPGTRTHFRGENIFRDHSTAQGE